MKYEVKIRPILFTAPTIQLLLDGSKTQTRKAAKEQQPPFSSCPYGEVGDLLWVRPYWSTGTIPALRAASNLTLKITSLRVERLQDISEEDAIAEGFQGQIEQFSQLWQPSTGEGSWNENPYVWVVGFEVIQQNVDEYLRGAA